MRHESTAYVRSEPPEEFKKASAARLQAKAAVFNAVAVAIVVFSSVGALAAIVAICRWGV